MTIPWNGPPIGEQTGWICPKCGSVYAPYYPQCTKCNKPVETVTTDNTSPFRLTRLVPPDTCECKKPVKHTQRGIGPGGLPWKGETICVACGGEVKDTDGD